MMRAIQALLLLAAAGNVAGSVVPAVSCCSADAWECLQKCHGVVPENADFCNECNGKFLGSSNCLHMTRGYCDATTGDAPVDQDLEGNVCPGAEGNVCKIAGCDFYYNYCQGNDAPVECSQELADRCTPCLTSAAFHCNTHCACGPAGGQNPTCSGAPCEGCLGHRSCQEPCTGAEFSACQECLAFTNFDSRKPTYTILGSILKGYSQGKFCGHCTKFAHCINDGLPLCELMPSECVTNKCKRVQGEGGVCDEKSCYLYHHCISTVCGSEDHMYCLNNPCEEDYAHCPDICTEPQGRYCASYCRCGTNLNPDCLGESCKDCAPYVPFCIDTSCTSPEASFCLNSCQAECDFAGTGTEEACVACMGNDCQRHTACVLDKPTCTQRSSDIQCREECTSSLGGFDLTTTKCKSCMNLYAHCPLGSCSSDMFQFCKAVCPNEAELTGDCQVCAAFSVCYTCSSACTGSCDAVQINGNFQLQCVNPDGICQVEECNFCGQAEAIRCQTQCRCGPEDYTYGPDGAILYVGASVNPSCGSPECAGCEQYRKCNFDCTAANNPWASKEDYCTQNCGNCLAGTNSFTDECKDAGECLKYCGGYAHCYTGGGLPCWKGSVECQTSCILLGSQSAECLACTPLYGHCTPICDNAQGCLSHDTDLCAWERVMDSDPVFKCSGTTCDYPFCTQCGSAEALRCNKECHCGTESELYDGESSLNLRCRGDACAGCESLRFCQRSCNEDVATSWCLKPSAEGGCLECLQSEGADCSNECLKVCTPYTHCVFKGGPTPPVNCETDEEALLCQGTCEWDVAQGGNKLMCTSRNQQTGIIQTTECPERYVACNPCQGNAIVTDCQSKCRCGPEGYMYANGESINAACESSICSGCTDPEVRQCFLPCDTATAVDCLSRCTDCFLATGDCTDCDKCTPYAHCATNGGLFCDHPDAVSCSLSQCPTGSCTPTVSCDLFAGCPDQCEIPKAISCKTECMCGPVGSPDNNNPLCLGSACEGCEPYRPCMKACQGAQYQFCRDTCNTDRRITGSCAGCDAYHHCIQDPVSCEGKKHHELCPMCTDYATSDSETRQACDICTQTYSHCEATCGHSVAIYCEQVSAPYCSVYGACIADFCNHEVGKICQGDCHWDSSSQFMCKHQVEGESGFSWEVCPTEYYSCNVCTSEKATQCNLNCACGPLNAQYDGALSLNSACNGEACKGCEEYRHCQKPCDSPPVPSDLVGTTYAGCDSTGFLSGNLPGNWPECSQFHHCWTKGALPCAGSSSTNLVVATCESFCPDATNPACTVCPEYAHCEASVCDSASSNLLSCMTDCACPTLEEKNLYNNPDCRGTSCKGCAAYRKCSLPCTGTETIVSNCITVHGGVENVASWAADLSCVRYYHCAVNHQAACKSVDAVAQCSQPGDCHPTTPVTPQWSMETDCPACLDAYGHCPSTECSPGLLELYGCTFEQCPCTEEGCACSHCNVFKDCLLAKCEDAGAAVCQKDCRYEMDGDNIVIKCYESDGTFAGICSDEYVHCVPCLAKPVRQCQNECLCGPSAEYVYPTGQVSVNAACDNARCNGCADQRQCMLPCSGDVYLYCKASCQLTSQSEKCEKVCSPYAHCLTGGGAPCSDIARAYCQIGIKTSCPSSSGFDPCTECSDYDYCGEICSEDGATQCMSQCACGPTAPAYAGDDGVTLVQGLNPACETDACISCGASRELRDCMKTCTDSLFFNCETACGNCDTLQGVEKDLCLRCWTVTHQEFCLPYFHCLSRGALDCPDTVEKTCEAACSVNDNDKCYHCVSLYATQCTFESDCESKVGKMCEERCPCQTADGCPELYATEECSACSTYKACSLADCSDVPACGGVCEWRQEQDEFKKYCNTETDTATYCPEAFHYCDVCDTPVTNDCLTKCACGPTGLCGGKHCELCAVDNRHCFKSCDPSPELAYCETNCQSCGDKCSESCVKLCAPYVHCMTNGQYPCDHAEADACTLNPSECTESANCECDRYTHCPFDAFCTTTRALSCSLNCRCGSRTFPQDVNPTCAGEACAGCEILRDCMGSCADPEASMCTEQCGTDSACWESNAACVQYAHCGFSGQIDCGGKTIYEHCTTECSNPPSRDSAEHAGWVEACSVCEKIHSHCPIGNCDSPLAKNCLDCVLLGAECSSAETEMCQPYAATCQELRCALPEAQPCSQSCLWDQGTRACSSCSTVDGVFTCDRPAICPEEFSFCDVCATQEAEKCMATCRCGPLDYVYGDQFSAANFQCLGQYCDACLPYRHCMRHCASEEAVACLANTNCVNDPLNPACKTCLPYLHCHPVGSLKGHVDCNLEEASRCNSNTCPGTGNTPVPTEPKDCLNCDDFATCPDQSNFCLADTLAYKCASDCQCGTSGTGANPTCAGERCSSCEIVRGCMSPCNDLDIEYTTCKAACSDACSDPTSALCGACYTTANPECLKYLHCVNGGRMSCLDNGVVVGADQRCSAECSSILVGQPNFGFSAACVTCLEENSHCDRSDVGCDSAIAGVCLSECSCVGDACVGECEKCKPFSSCPRTQCLGTADELACSELCNNCRLAEAQKLPVGEECASCTEATGCLPYSACLPQIPCPAGNSWDSCSNVCKYDSQACLTCQSQGGDCSSECGSVSDCVHCRDVLRHCDNCDQHIDCMLNCACGPEGQLYKSSEGGLVGAPNSDCDTSACVNRCDRNSRNCMRSCEEVNAIACVGHCQADPLSDTCRTGACVAYYHCFTLGYTPCVEQPTIDEVCMLDCATQSVSAGVGLPDVAPACSCLETVHPNCPRTSCDSTAARECQAICRYCAFPTPDEVSTSENACGVCNGACRAYWHCGPQQDSCGFVKDSLECYYGACTVGNPEQLQNPNTATCRSCIDKLQCSDICDTACQVNVQCNNCFLHSSDCGLDCPANCHSQDAVCVVDQSGDCESADALLCYKKCGSCLSSENNGACSEASACPVSCYKYRGCGLQAHSGSSCQSTLGKECMDNCLNVCTDVAGCPDCVTGGDCPNNNVCQGCSAYSSCVSCAGSGTCTAVFRSEFYCRFDLVTGTEYKTLAATNGCTASTFCSLEDCKNNPPAPTDCIIPEINRLSTLHTITQCTVDTSLPVDVTSSDVSDLLRRAINTEYFNGQDLLVSEYATLCKNCWTALDLAIPGVSRCTNFDTFRAELNKVCSSRAVLAAIEYQSELELIDSVSTDCPSHVLENVIIPDEALPTFNQPGEDLVASCQAMLDFSLLQNPNTREICSCAEFLYGNEDYADVTYGVTSDNFCFYLDNMVTEYVALCRSLPAASCIESGSAKLITYLNTNNIQNPDFNGWDMCGSAFKLENSNFPDEQDVVTEDVCYQCLPALKKVLANEQYAAYHRDISILMYDDCQGLGEKFDLCPAWGTNAEEAAQVASCFPSRLDELDAEFSSLNVLTECRAVRQIGENTLSSLPIADQQAALRDLCTTCLNTVPAASLDASSLSSSCDPFATLLSRLQGICVDWTETRAVSKVDVPPTPGPCLQAKLDMEAACPGFLDTSSGELALDAETVARYCSNSACRVGAIKAADAAAQCTGPDAVWGYIFDVICIKSPIVILDTTSSLTSFSGGEYCAPYIFPVSSLDTSVTNPADCESICAESVCEGITCTGSCQEACDKVSGCVWYPNAFPVNGKDQRCGFVHNAPHAAKECHACLQLGNDMKLAFALRAAQQDPTTASSIEEHYYIYKRSCTRVGSEFCRASLQDTRDPLTGEYNVVNSCNKNRPCLNAIIRSNAPSLDTGCQLEADPASCVSARESARAVSRLRVKHVCTTNNDNSKFCGDITEPFFLTSGIYKNTPLRECAEQYLTNEQCSTECSTLFRDRFADAGCCLGSLDDVFSTMKELGQMPSHVSVQNLLNTCAIQQTIPSPCSRRGTKTTNLRVSLQITCTAVESDPDLKNEMTNSIVSDLADFLGIDSGLFDHPAITCDVTVKVQVSGGRVKVLASETGVTAGVDLRAQDDDATNNAANAFANGANQGTLSLPSTASAVTRTTGKSLQIDVAATQNNAPGNTAPVANNNAPVAAPADGGGSQKPGEPSPIGVPPTPVVPRPPSSPLTPQPISGGGGGTGALINSAGRLTITIGMLIAAIIPVLLL
eukprot:TRINITY_DN514_c5_g1_i1.p1 TRINITY_DN514_c5_g1~~TRINITY_DN514_c5_g1_i1.p1  ORF type:complete len:4099 (+),score=698.74 TRINITY_DN514_c5_g1_i1:89-12385(+)